MPHGGQITASVTVTNTGHCDGMETVQLYIHAIHSTSTRPVKELKGFRKVFIPSGQSVTIDFLLDEESLSYYNHGLEWTCENGDYQIFIGPNSRDTQMARISVQ